MSMKAAPRARDTRGFTHSPGSRLSIDPEHHVTEAIGDMYGDLNNEAGDRYSYMQSLPGDSSSTRSGKRQSTLSVPVPQNMGAGSGGVAGDGNGEFGGRGGAGGHSNGQTTPPTSPTLSIRATSPSLGDPAHTPLPLNDFEYESDPVAVAQEISNLQALRRMSMDVTSSADPDLPSFNNFVPPTPPDDGGDPGSVFWVPARLHPELAPQEFSAFLEAKKNEIRRPQAREGSLSPDPTSGGGPGLRRKKSMLSRQISDVEGVQNYQDGADRLGKRKSLQGDATTGVQLEDFMKDPTALMHKLSVDSKRRTEGNQPDDAPIIFAPKVGLKRSTATHYRKGSLRRGDRVGPKRGGASKAAEAEGDESPPKIGFKLERSSTEPTPPSKNIDESGLLRHGRKSPPVPATSGPSISLDELLPKATPESSPAVGTVQDKHKSAPAKTRRSSSPKAMARSRTSEPPPPVPKIVETPPPIPEHPERNSSFDQPPQQLPPVLGSTRKRPGLNRMESSSDLSSVKSEPASREKKEGKDRKTSWGWIRGDPDKDKEKHDKKERDKQEKDRTKREKRPRSSDKSDKYDSTRLDVLQKSIEMGNTGRVVGALDPAASPDRRSRGEEKKEKDSGFLSFFGGSRKKSGDHSAEKKGRSSRGTSPDPPHEKQQPFYYTRFPIHIERAIYRLSHLKLANPRRPLQQQVLLSNFMYSYLAKVQQTQPHLIQQATNSQKQQEALERQRKEQEQPQPWQQQQQPQPQDGGNGTGYYYEDGAGDHDYLDDGQVYDYDDDRPGSRRENYGSGGGGGGGGGSAAGENGYAVYYDDYGR